MGKIKSFKQEFSLDQRLKESQNIIVKYPDRVPVPGTSPSLEYPYNRDCYHSTIVETCLTGKVIIEKYSRTDLPDLDKKKYLVPRDMSVGQFIHILSSRLRLPPGKALFIFVKNTLPQTASLMNSIYQSYKEDDGFLYMNYSSEKTFG